LANEAGSKTTATDIELTKAATLISCNQENMMATNPLAPYPLTDGDGPPILEPDYNEPIEDPDTGGLPVDEPEDEVPEEDPDDEPLANDEGEVFEEPIGESDVEIDDELFREHHATTEGI
jgi:hypothetical protein